MDRKTQLNILDAFYAPTTGPNVVLDKVMNAVYAAQPELKRLEKRVKHLEEVIMQFDAALIAQSTYHQDDGQWMYLIDGDTANAAQSAARAALEKKDD